MKKQILFVGEDRELWPELQRAGAPPGAQWNFAFARTGAEALAELGRQPCDAVVADLELPGVNGALLLDEVLQRQPQAVRFIRADLAEHARAMKCVGTAHQFLLKPCDAATIHAALRRAFASDAWLPGAAVQVLMPRLTKLPSPPELYFKVVKALQSPDASLEDVGELIGRDLAMTAKLLQLVNSAVFGLQLQVASAGEAVMYLGLDTTKSLILLAHSFSYFDQLKLAGFSLDTFWRHSLTTGHCARWIAEAENAGEEITGQAFTAGLLHDLGKLLLAANLPDEYGAALQRARGNQLALADAEREIFQATHAEVGACLLGIWGLPPPIVEACAWHHTPTCLGERTFTPLTAVHAANVLAHELESSEPGLVTPALEAPYLTELGCAERVSEWRTICQERLAAAAA